MQVTSRKPSSCWTLALPVTRDRKSAVDHDQSAGGLSRRQSSLSAMRTAVEGERDARLCCRGTGVEKEEEREGAEEQREAAALRSRALSSRMPAMACTC